MKKMKSIYFSQMMAMCAIAANPIHSKQFNDGSIGHGIPDNPKKVIPKGCKEYTFYGVTVVATSEKSAIKKIKKKLNK